MADQRLSAKYVIVVIGGVIFTWLLHEFAHWLISESFGYETIMRVNGTSVGNEVDPPALHKIFISASGPIVTIIQGVITFLLLKNQGWNKYFYPFLLTPFYMRFLAGSMNIIHPNDEGRISVLLGMGTFTLPIIVSALLFIMVYVISKKFHLNWKFQSLTILIIMITSTILILSDQFFSIRLL